MQKVNTESKTTAGKVKEGNSREKVFWQIVISFILVVTISEAHNVLYQLDA